MAEAAGEDDVLTKVQQVLFEDEEFMGQLEAWCAERCEGFDVEDEGEHKLEWTGLHEEFCLLFERRITGFLEVEGHSVEVRLSLADGPASTY
jgi:hypothetical protein